MTRTMSRDLLHPRTGLPAIGIGKRGPIWPVLGGDGTNPAPADPGPPADLPQPPADPPAPDPAGDEPLGDAGKKALSEERKARKAADKRATDAEAKLKGIEDAQKSDQQKATERADAADKRATEAEAKLLRLEVAQEKGLTAKQIKYLTGTTREELEAAAEEILADFPAQPGATPTPPAPKPDPSQGARGNPPSGRPTTLSQAVTQALKPKS